MHNHIRLFTGKEMRGKEMRGKEMRISELKDMI